MPLHETLQRLEQHATDKPVTLPSWPASKRACPSVAFRSALFPPLARGQRKMLDHAEIFAVGPVTVRFTGRQLDQTDLDVYLELLHRFNGQQSDCMVEITAYGLLKSLGRSLGSSGYAWLDASLMRLVGGLIEITAETRSQRYRGHLLESTTENIATGAYKITLNRDFARLFANGWSSLDIAQRSALKSPSAKSLHAYLSSHKAPGQHSWATLAGITGLSGKNARSTLREALGQLQAVGFLSSWSETGGLVTFKITN